MTTEAQCVCPHCHGPILITAETQGKISACPHCQNAVSLPFLSPATPPVIIQQAPRKQHGVFYYVFWGVVSLIATLFILSAVGIVGLGSLFVAASAKTHTEQSATSGAANPADDKQDYITNHLQLYDFSAGYHKTYLEDTQPGVEFKIKNNGDRALKKIEVTVYFLDRSGQTIFEKQFYPVWVTSMNSDQPLKPGYIWQQEAGHFYAAKQVPSEWQEGRCIVKITNIEFASR